MGEVTRRLRGWRAGSAQYRDAMKITETIEYAATPEQVFAMVSDEAFQDRKCVATGATEHQVTIAADGDRTVVTSERSMPTADLDLPSFANVGPALHVVEVQDWGPAAADGSREGRLSVALKGLPIGFKGALALRPGGRGTTETISGDLKSTIPLFGGKAEKAAAPGILAGIRVEHETGEAWLAG